MSFLREILRSSEGTQFSINNIPFGVYLGKADSRGRCCSRIGEYIIDLKFLEGEKLIQTEGQCFQGKNLNKFMSQGEIQWKSIRR